jgi:hypothetical protein
MPTVKKLCIPAATRKVGEIDIQALLYKQKNQQNHII